jgi:hypothetical protein
MARKTNYTTVRTLGIIVCGIDSSKGDAARLIIDFYITVACTILLFGFRVTGPTNDLLHRRNRWKQLGMDTDTLYNKNSE